ncbi:glycosyl transferase [Paenibacillus antri]|uniref:Glycosyl transferase n=1 Tax=Paenibacillus antri TaxID=2582848 RepID=A0A5R9FZB5_9BACL|nr:glycosyltransferase [Paenibacillus antri]TLS49402.1 glycosyl transferase [Paenibacillus antri]
MNEGARIPKRIHYCWFGRGEKPKKIAMCMQSWKKHLSDYEFVEWNEDTFDLNANAFVREAYDAKKYAFVSDFVRLHALYEYGGIYLDTDVEVVKSLDPLLTHEAFSGFEDETNLQSGTMGAVKGHSWIYDLLTYYEGKPFVLPDGSLDTTSNTSIMTRMCAQEGLVTNGNYQELPNGVVFYPRTYFSPYDYINGATFISDESYTIHHFAKSWLPTHVRLRGEVKRIVGRYIGPRFIASIRAIMTGSRS